MRLKRAKEKRSIEKDYQMLLSVSQKKDRVKDGLEIYVYGDAAEIIDGTIILLQEISESLEISFDDFCEMLRFFKKMKGA